MRVVAVAQVLAAFAATQAQAAGELRLMLDVSTQLVGAGASYNDTQYQALAKCMKSRGSSLFDSQEASWSGFMNYFMTNGTKSDPWGSCITCHQYQEHNLTALPGKTPAIIYEPCNYVSNAAYYRVATEVCERKESSWTFPPETVTALVQGYVALAFGSSFWHGSHTYLGNVCDNEFIAVISFVAYQASVLGLPCADDTSCNVLRDLNTTARTALAVNSTQKLTDMFASTEIDFWLDGIYAALDMPDYFLTFAAIIVQTLTLILPNQEQVVTFLVSKLSKLFNLPAEDLDFINNTYLPALRYSLQKVNVTKLEAIDLMLKGTGTIFKLMYAFLWQEWIIPTKFFLKPEVNKIGAELMPIVNDVANALSAYTYVEPSLQKCVDVYPADSRCRKEQPHSKWHEESANGLLDLMFLCDRTASFWSNNTANRNSYSLDIESLEARRAAGRSSYDELSRKLSEEGARTIALETEEETAQAETLNLKTLLAGLEEFWGQFEIVTGGLFADYYDEQQQQQQ